MCPKNVWVRICDVNTHMCTHMCPIHTYHMYIQKHLNRDMYV